MNDTDARDALLAAALHPLEDAQRAWERLRATENDLSRNPVALRWLPLVGENLKHGSVDDRSREICERARREAWASNTRTLTAAEPAIQTLVDNGIPLALLKGAALDATVYGARGLRPFGDVDVLVPYEHAHAARDLLLSHGWRASTETRTTGIVPRHAWNLEQPPHGALDLHWHLLPDCCWPSADAGLWQRVRRLPGHALPLHVLAPSDQLLHACLHGLHWHPVDARHWIADAARVIAHAGDDLGWDLVAEEAARRDLVVQTGAALRLVRDEGRAPVPDRVFAALGRSRTAWLDRAECRARTRPLAGTDHAFVAWRRWARLARAGVRIPASSYLAEIIGLTSRWQLFPWAVRRIGTRLTRLARAFGR